MRAVHVSALYAPVSNRAGCNRGATSGARRPSLTGWICSALFCLAVSPSAAPACPAQDTAAPPDSAPTAGQRASATVSFLGGAVAGFVAHEAGHAFFDTAFNAEPGLKRVSFGPIPFFAITHQPVGRRQEFVISSAGFWVQHATSEWLLTRRPHLRDEHAPFAKGVLAWNVAASVVYSGAAFARIGPPERDTRGMAVSLGVAEPWIGVLVLGPAVLDAVRYLRPRARWAGWTSRGLKVTAVLLTAAAH